MSAEITRINGSAISRSAFLTAGTSHRNATSNASPKRPLVSSCTFPACVSLATADGLEGLPIGNLAAGDRHDHERLVRALQLRRQELQLAGRTFTECE